MRLYTILKNGFAIGQAVGKKKALECIQAHVLDRDIKGTWETVGGEIRFHYVKDNVEGHYTIKENKGDL